MSEHVARALLVATMLAAGVVEAQPETATDPAVAPEPAASPDLDHAHAEVGAFGSIDIVAIREHPGFSDLVTRTLARFGVTPAASAAVVRMLAHTRTISGTLTYAAGDTAQISTVVLRGDYGATEVPDAFHGILPALARGLWYPTRIDGHRAFDLGLAALVEVEPDVWLITRRIDGNLALGGRARVPQALRDEVARARRLLPSTTGFGGLVGPRATIPGNEAPRGLEDLFRGPERAITALYFDQGRAIVEVDVTLHHRSDALRWEAAYRENLRRLPEDIEVSAALIRSEVTLTGNVLHGRVELEPVAVDAFVARLAGGRLLTTSPAPPTAPNRGLGP